MESKVRYRIGDNLQFEAAGEIGFVQREREIFLDILLSTMTIEEIRSLIIPEITNNDEIDEDFTEVVERDKKPSKSKTQLDDCASCLCNTCVRIEICQYVKEGCAGLDPERPNPCKGCYDGMRFTPIGDTAETKITCSSYTEGSGNYV